MCSTMATSFFLVLCSLVVLPIAAHSHINFPRPQFQDGFKKINMYIGDIDIKIFAPQLGKLKHEEGVVNIAKAIKYEHSPSLRQFVYDHMRLLPVVDETNRTFMPTPECGFTVTTDARVPVPDDVIFPWPHPGPCEIWCDNTLVASGRDCHPTDAKFHLDKAKCATASLLQATFVAVHSHHWQVFTNCVPLEGGSETDPKHVFHYRPRGTDTVFTPVPSVATPTSPPPVPTPSSPPSVSSLPPAPSVASDATLTPEPSVSTPTSLSPTKCAAI